MRERRRWAGDDRGATTTELSLVFPIFLTLLFLLIQASLYYHARNVASTAAQEAAAIASEYGRTADLAQAAGEAEGMQYMESQVWQGSGDVNVGFVQGGDAVQATAGGTVQNVFPFVNLLPDLEINEVSQRPVERFVPPGED